MFFREGERLDDLQYRGLWIIQDPELYCFTSDAVALANFVSGAKGKRMAELCAGSGVISLLVNEKQKPAKITAVEIQPSMCDMALRSVRLNGRQDDIDIICGDVKDALSFLPKDAFDIVVVNPPYRKKGCGQMQLKPEIALSRHEIALDLNSLMRVSSALLKTKGAMYLVHRFDRLAEVFYEMKNFLIEPKEIKVLFGKNRVPNSVLIKGVKQGNSGLRWIGQ